MKAIVKGLFIVGALFAAASARADSIQKWRTPDGELHFGVHPPAGSTLLETIPDTPRAEGPPVSVVDAESGLSREAAEGRDIIRRREADRAEERRREAERRERLDELAARAEEYDWYDTPLWIFTTPPCAPGQRCVDDGHRGRHRDHDGDRRWSRRDWQRRPEPGRLRVIPQGDRDRWRY